MTASISATVFKKTLIFTLRFVRLTWPLVLTVASNVSWMVQVRLLAWTDLTRPSSSCPITGWNTTKLA